MNKAKLLIDLQYLPCVQYVCYLYFFDEVYIEIHDHFEKQSYRNRCRIRGANNIEDLIIPVKHKNGKRITAEAEIDHQQKWINKHRRAIMSAYGKAPFYEYYEKEIMDVFNKRHNYLVDLNKELLTKCLELLETDLKIQFTEKYIESTETPAFYDARGNIHPKKGYSNDLIFQPASYFQVFGSNFAANLSIIDLIFCEGPEALKFIKKSLRSERQI